MFTNINMTVFRNGYNKYYKADLKYSENQIKDRINEKFKIKIGKIW